MGISEQLKKARLKIGYTQKQVADKMGITKSAYCGYEIGKRRPDVEKIKKLAEILGTSGDTLLETGYDIRRESETLENICFEAGKLTEEERLFILDIIRAMQSRLKNEKSENQTGTV